jgi:DNA-binding IclR family transcriptional regulator
MVCSGTDMTEHPDDILRALADTERLKIAGALAAGDAAAAPLAGSLGLPVARVRRHLTRLAAAGVTRLQPDRRTYRLDPETLRWAAEQVGPPARRVWRSAPPTRTRRPCCEPSSATGG